MKPLALAAALALLFTLPPRAVAQVTLDGAWEGDMIVGGIYSNKRLPMQLYLTTEGTQVTGRSYVKLPDGEILRMDLEGQLYGDLSIILVETDFAGDALNDLLPEFNRQYQIVYKPDLYDSELRGYWQEVTEDTMHKFRKRGKMVLRKQRVKGV